MIVATCRIELYIPEANSLKAKRKVIKSLKDQLRNRFNVAIAEVELQDLWQRSILGVVTLSNDRSQVDATLAKVISFVEGTDLAIIGHYEIEVW
ncbi:MAG: DUF503 domain-containing protein [bacterium]|nr:DUF503 domain-containing protein [bacterium]